MGICKENGCNLNCGFGLIDKKATHCSKHKSEGMVNVSSKKCIIEGCQKEASFKQQKTKKRTHCSEHKLDGMDSTKNRRCLEKNCYTRASHNLQGEKPLYCEVHKLENMVDVRGKRCKNENCYKYPLYNLKGEYPAYCSEHKLENMINVKQKRCTSCQLFLVVKKNNYLCYYCQPTPRLLKKEQKVKTLLEEKGLTFTHNKQFKNDCCLKYRCDFLFDCNTYYVVLECDENEHKGYEQECELIRMNNISIGLGLPTLFIRYNPDLPGFTQKQKHKKLIDTLNKYLSMDILEDPTPVYLFYSKFIHLDNI